VNGRISKMLRRKILGEGYSWKAEKKYVVDANGTVRLEGKRGQYRRAKKDYRGD